MNITVISVPLSAIARTQLASMAYHRWCIAHDNLKKVKTETWETSGKFCPRGDFPASHKHRILHAQEECDIATALRDEICSYSPLMMSISQPKEGN